MSYTELRNVDGLTEAEFLENYKPGDYERPSNTVDMLLFTVGEKNTGNIRKDTDKELKILLIKRKNHPEMHKWALPGGFVDINENISTAANRELKEETNVENVYMEQLYTYGNVNRDKRMRVISIAHMALVPSDNIKPIAGDDAEDVAWFSVSKTKVNNTEHKIVVSNENLGLYFTYTVNISFEKNGIVSMPKFDIVADDENKGVAFDHIYMINDGIDRLRNKINYVPIAFNLVPPKFTLNEIQQVYEIILGHSLTKQNFRKWIDKYVIALDEMQTTVGHRPAQLYKYVETEV